MPIKDPVRRRAKQREYASKWYAANKDKQKKTVSDRRRELYQWFRDLKSTMSCQTCGENHPACLDFHHRDPSQKDGIMREFLVAGRSKKSILKEISKCDVLCANCHRKLHWNESHDTM